MVDVKVNLEDYKRGRKCGTHVVMRLDEILQHAAPRAPIAADDDQDTLVFGARARYRRRQIGARVAAGIVSIDDKGAVVRRARAGGEAERRHYERASAHDVFR